MYYFARAQISQVVPQILANHHIQANKTKHGRLAHWTVRTIPSDQQTIQDVRQQATAQVSTHLVNGLLHHADRHQVLGILGRFDEGLENASARLRRQTSRSRADHFFDQLGQLVWRRLLVLFDQLQDGQLYVVGELFVLELEELPEREHGLDGQLVVALIGRVVQVVEQTEQDVLEVLVPFAFGSVARLDQLG